MDTVRSKRKNKTLWIFGGSVAVVVLIVILILCITLSGGETPEETEKPTVATQTSTQGELGTVPEAFRFLEEVLIQTLDHEDKKEKEYFDDFMTVKWKVMKVLAEKADAEEKKNASGKTKKTSESGTSTKDEGTKPGKAATAAGVKGTAKTTTAQEFEADKTSAAKTEPKKTNGKTAEAAPTAKTAPEAKVEPEVQEAETTAEDLSDTESVYDTGSEGGYETSDEFYDSPDPTFPDDRPKVIPMGPPPASESKAEEPAKTDETPKCNLKGKDKPAGKRTGVWTYTKNKATGAWEYVKDKKDGAKAVFTGAESALGSLSHA